jgi:hypothetical protein
LVCVSTREEIQFPSVLLQPLGHLSAFKINDLRAVGLRLSHTPPISLALFHRVSIQRFTRRSAGIDWKLCQTCEGRAITYGVFVELLLPDRKYRKALLRKGVERLLAGDLDMGKAIIRGYINATIGFEELSRRTKRPAKSLMRMLGPSGNPRAVCSRSSSTSRERRDFSLSCRSARPVSH